jgi:DNA-binding MarR family transcriptional regulator
MGSIQDLLQEVPLAAVLRERVALADQKYEAALHEVELLKRKVEALQRENADLRAQIPEDGEADLSDDTKGVLVRLFKATREQERDVKAMAAGMGMERGVLQYHLDRLREAGLANRAGGNALRGDTYWSLTAKGRQRVVEGKLI